MIAVAQVRGGRSRDAVSPLLSQRLFLVIAALVFAASAMLTVEWCRSMSVMPGMPMTGGWTMSMAWMRMPRQTWLSAGASFVGMWAAMMVAMMLPSLLPMLRGFRQAIRGTSEMRINKLTAIVGAGYFFVWTLLGILLFPLCRSNRHTYEKLEVPVSRRKQSLEVISNRHKTALHPR